MTSPEDKARFYQTYATWIKEIGSCLTLQQNPTAYSDAVYTHPNNVTVSIRQLNEDSDRIILATNLNFPPDAQQLIASLGSPERAGFANEVALMLTQMGIQFNFQVQNDILQSITVERTVFGESMTKQIFFDNLYRIIDALAALQIRFHQRLGTGTSKVASGGSATNTSFYG